jgi:hypothetical protein
MPVTSSVPTPLLDALTQLAPDEFASLLEQAAALRSKSNPSRLSAKESRLILRINRGIPDSVSRRYEQLLAKQRRDTLTDLEHRQLVRLIDRIEARDAERAAELVELARIRRVPLRALMKQMGIKAPPVRG